MTVSRDAAPSSLVGSVVRLDPSAATDAAELFAALDDPAVYAMAYHGGARPAAPSEVADWVRAANDAGRRMYTVRLAADSSLGAQGLVVGTTSLGDIDEANGGAHLGWTAYTPDTWGSAVNPECKLLLLGDTFGRRGFERVKIQTDIINLHSQAAIAKLGAVREGVLRHHRRRADGSWRDTVVFSVLSDEWPRVRSELARRVETWRAADLPPGDL